MPPATSVVYRPLFAETEFSRSQFCNTLCAWRGTTLLDSRPIPEREFEQHLHGLHGGKCPICEGAGPVGVHRSHVAWSVFLVPLWSSMSQVCCRSCGIKLQLGGVAFCFLFGFWGIPFCWFIPPLVRSWDVGFASAELWGIPFGSIITPLGIIYGLNRFNFGLQVLRNLKEMIFGPDPRTPSATLETSVRSCRVSQKSPRPTAGRPNLGVVLARPRSSREV
jgi:hypothetical protein